MNILKIKFLLSIIIIFFLINETKAQFAVSGQWANAKAQTSEIVTLTLITSQDDERVRLRYQGNDGQSVTTL